MASGPYHQIPMDPIVRLPINIRSPRIQINNPKPSRSRLIDPQDPFSVRGVTFADDSPEYTAAASRIQRTLAPHNTAFNPYATSSGPSSAPTPTLDPTSYEPFRTAAQKQEAAEAALPPRPIPVSKKRVCWNFWWFVLCFVLLLSALVIGLKWRFFAALFHIHLPDIDGEGQPLNSTMPGNSSMGLTTMYMPVSTPAPTSMHTMTSAAATTKINTVMTM